MKRAVCDNTRGELYKPETSQDNEVSIIMIHGNREEMEG